MCELHDGFIFNGSVLRNMTVLTNRRYKPELEN